MTTVVLVQAQPRIAATGALVDVRLAGGGSRPYDHMGFADWRAGGVAPPRFSTAIGFEQTGWTGAALPTTASVRYFPFDKAWLSQIANYHWIGARIVITTADDEAVAVQYTTQLIGEVAAIQVEGGALTLTLADLSGDLDKPVCPNTFAGTGDLEGGDEATGRVKRRTWGYAFNIEGFVLDKANAIYEFGDPNRPLNAFPMVKDKGREAGSYVNVAWQGSAAATLTTLRNTAAPSGGCVRAPSIACVKWWTTPAGPLTADVQGEVGAGYVQTAPEIAARLVSIYSTLISVANTAEALGWQSAVAGVHADQAVETVGNLLDRLLLPVSTVWLLGANGSLSFRRFTWTGSIETLTADTIERETTFQPLKTRRVGFQRNHRQHSDAEISAVLLSATDATYADGTPIETLKPAQAGADVTSGNTAAAITGQGPGATATGLQVLNQNVTIGANGQLSGAGGGQVTYSGVGGGALGLLARLFFGSNLLQETDGGAVATLVNFKTAQGTASAIAGQGAFATVSTAAYGSSLLTGFAALAAQASIKLGGGFIFRNDGSTALTDALAVTSLGTASAIAGQGAFATISSAAYGSSLLTGFAALAAQPNVYFGSAFVLESAGGAQATLAAFKTAQGTAAAITGQGEWATTSRPVAAAFAGYPNLVYDGGFRLRAQRWAVITAGFNYAMSGADGAYLSNVTNAGYRVSATFPMIPGFIYGLAVDMFAAGQTAGRLVTDIECLNASGQTIGYISGVIAVNGSGWTSYFNTGPAPDGSVSGRVRIFMDTNPANSNNAVRRVKVTPYNFPTPFSDEATSGAAYLDGAAMEALKPQEIGSNVTEGRTSAAFTGQGQLATLNSVAFNTTRITRADGTTIVTESIVVTSLGTASAIAGQGTGATANTLAQLDQAAADRLAAAQGGQMLTVAYGGTITRTLGPNEAIPFNASVFREAGGGGGTIQVRVRGGPSGGTQSTLATGPGATVSNTEPGGDTVSGTFTNQTGIRQAFTFTVDDVRTPSTAGGAIRASQSYLQA